MRENSRCSHKLMISSLMSCYCYFGGIVIFLFFQYYLIIIFNKTEVFCTVIAQKWCTFSDSMLICLSRVKNWRTRKLNSQPFSMAKGLFALSHRRLDFKEQNGSSSRCIHDVDDRKMRPTFPLITITSTHVGADLTCQIRSSFKFQSRALHLYQQAILWRARWSQIGIADS
jgi:hypothetical protein